MQPEKIYEIGLKVIPPSDFKIINDLALTYFKIQRYHRFIDTETALNKTAHVCILQIGFRWQYQKG